MGFTSLAFLVFFPAVFLIYLLIPRRARAVWLLAASYAFCISFGAEYALALFLSTLATYFLGILIESRKETQIKKLCIAAAVFLHVLFLAFFKYNRLQILLPVGISFYTFQAIGYLADVYRGMAAERNMVDFALFQAFFPKLVQGPIERSDSLLEQIRSLRQRELFDMQRIREGTVLILWGLFQKLMIADRIAIPVNAVYRQFGAFGGVEILLVTVLYAFQIYCDFAGYTDIARGAARILGIELKKNFMRPYLADSVQDFWRRWHISLSSWLRDYLYIPLGGSRKGRLRKYANIMITFLISGIWHGTGFHFLAWGGLHGLGQIFDIKNIKLPRWLKRVLVFCFADLAWMVFRANSLGDVKGMLLILFTDFRLRDYKGMELAVFEWALVFAGILLVMAKDILEERGVCIRECLFRQTWLVRCLIYTAMAAGIVIFGVYGAAYDTSQFLYTKF
ncbi:peptidoglycan O-acetyltransferase [Lachnospiraceae bacterium]|nr:peptidoglycan O-acetyltransferase [Lachnospiraceae bacterium]